MLHLPLERERVVAVAQPEQRVHPPRLEHRRVARAARQKPVVLSQPPPDVVGHADVAPPGAAASDEHVNIRLLEGHAGTALARRFALPRPGSRYFGDAHWHSVCRTYIMRPTQPPLFVLLFATMINLWLLQSFYILKFFSTPGTRVSAVLLNP